GLRPGLLSFAIFDGSLTHTSSSSQFQHDPSIQARRFLSRGSGLRRLLSSHRVADLALRPLLARRSCRRRRSLSGLLDNVVGLPPNLRPSTPTLSRQRFLSLSLLARV